MNFTFISKEILDFIKLDKIPDLIRSYKISESIGGFTGDTFLEKVYKVNWHYELKEKYILGCDVLLILECSTTIGYRWLSIKEFEDFETHAKPKFMTYTEFLKTFK